MIIGLEPTGLQREPTGKESDCKDHWLLDPLRGLPFLTYLGLQSIPRSVFLRGVEDVIDTVSN